MIIESMKQALEALRGFRNPEVGCAESFEQCGAAIRTLRTAIAEAEKQEPVAWKHDCAALLQNDVELWVDRCSHCGKPRTTPPAAPVQEPMAWLYPEGLEALQQGKCWTAYGTKQDPQCIPVYLNGAVAQKVEPAQAECGGFDSRPASPLSQFVRASTQEEKAAIYAEAVKQADAEQMRVMQSAPVQEANEDYLSKAYRLANELRSHLIVAPAAEQRHWVGLTDAERRACTQSPFTVDNYRAIEAKLKEKNT